MNRKAVVNTIGWIVMAEAGFMLLPLIVSLCYREKCALSFLLSTLIALVVGGSAVLFCRPKNKVIYAKEGFVIVAFAWVIMSLIGALPFVISKEIPSYFDAFFETVSGFTTTGASILSDVEALSHGTLFWRSFTHWIGGMGVLVFVMAIMPGVSDRTIHIMRAEMPGPVVGKLVPRVRDTAKILYLIYIALTAIETLMLLFGGMTFFESITHAMGTAGTGGFGIKADSLGSYSPYIQWVITAFMLVFGVNFNLYYLILVKRARQAFRSEEFWVYIGIVAASAGVICANVYSMFDSFGESIRHSFFQVASIISTTGFSTVDFDLWPTLSKTILLIIMFIGACAGSTAGGFKISRVVMLFKLIRREVKLLIHPRTVESVSFEEKKVDEKTLSSVGNYLAIYVGCFIVTFLLVSFEKFDLITNFSAVTACFNNIGPGFGAVGPSCSFAAYSDFSKVVLSAAMLFGRLEIFPMIIAFSPKTWIRR